MNKYLGLVLFSFFLGCGIPKDEYYARYSTRSSSPSTIKDKNHPSHKDLRGARYNNHNNTKKDNRSRIYTKSDMTDKERLNQELHNETLRRPDNSTLESHNRKSYLNYAPPMAINRNDFIERAKKYIGVRYLYGGTDPGKGLDCSGFVMNVFNDFGIKSPRVSRDIALYGQEVSLDRAKKGDLIFFTGRNHASGIIGHLGIIVETKPNIKFIHSATTNNVGVIISDFTGYYEQHFVKVMSVLK